MPNSLYIKLPAMSCKTLLHPHPNGGGLVANSSYVAQTAYVGKNAIVYGRSQVLGEAVIDDNASVWGEAIVAENAKVYGNASVSNDSRVYGNAKVYENAQLWDKSQICGNAQVYGYSRIKHNAIVQDNARVYGHTVLEHNVNVYGSATVDIDYMMSNEHAPYLGGKSFINNDFSFLDICPESPLKFVYCFTEVNNDVFISRGIMNFLGSKEKILPSRFYTADLKSALLVSGPHPVLHEFKELELTNFEVLSVLHR